MATLKPLVIKNGQIQQLQEPEDTIVLTVTSVGIITRKNTEVSTIPQCTPVYLATDGTLGLDVKRALATSSLTAKVIGLVYDANITTGNLGVIQTDGVFTTATAGVWNDVISEEGGLSIGNYYYLSQDPGLISATPPALATQYVVEIGFAISATQMLLSTSFRPILL